MASMDKVYNGIWLGNVIAARDLQSLSNVGVTHVLNCAALQCPSFYPQHFRYKSMSLTDTPSQNIMQHFGETSAFIREARSRGGSIFLHCVEGKSRSATCVIAFLIDNEGMALTEALHLVKQARPIVRPNEGFLIQLAHYEKIARAGHVMLTGGSLQAPKGPSGLQGFNKAGTSSQPMLTPQHHQRAHPLHHSQQIHSGHAVSQSQNHVSQWTGRDQGLNRLSAPPQMPLPPQQSEYVQQAYSSFTNVSAQHESYEHRAEPSLYDSANTDSYACSHLAHESPDSRYTRKRLAPLHSGGGVHVLQGNGGQPHVVQMNRHEHANQRDTNRELLNNRDASRGLANMGAHGPDWSAQGARPTMPAANDLVSQYGSHSRAKRSAPRQIGYRTSSAGFEGEPGQYDPQPERQEQDLQHLEYNDVADRISLHAAVHRQSLANASQRANAQRYEFQQFFQQRRPPRTSDTAVPAHSYSVDGNATQRAHEYRQKAASRPDAAAMLHSHLHVGENDDSEIDWSVLTKDTVFQHLMNSGEEGGDAPVGEVKKFVAGRAIVGKELTC